MEKLLSIGGQNALFEGITVELRHSFKQVPKEEKSTRVVVRVGAKDFEDRADVQVTEHQAIRGPIEERCVAVLQQGCHLGVDGPQNDQTAFHLRIFGKAVDFRLQKRAEITQLLAMKVLELVDRDDVAGLRKLPDEFCQGAKTRDSLGHSEGLQIAVACGNHTDGVGVGDLEVKSAIQPRFAESLMNQRGLSDAASTGDLQKEPTMTIQDRTKLAKFGLAAVELPGFGRLAHQWVTYSIKIFTLCKSVS